MKKRTDYTLLASAIAFLWALIFADRCAAQNFQRLPRTYPIAQLERLPKPDDSPTMNGPHLESGGTVRFAGGGIEIQVPEGWWAQEVPFGREVRLVLAPQRPAPIRRMPMDGIWIAYHAVPHPGDQEAGALSRELAERLQAAIEDNGKYSSPTLFQFGRWPAAVAEFTASDSSSSVNPITGRHVLVRTEWGVLEFHASAPDAIVESRSDLWTATWESLRLNRPTTAEGTSAEGRSESHSIIGDWKAFRSRMRFSRDGRIVIIPDVLDGNRNSKPLAGTFESRDDLIFVQWDDGSRLNLRWRLQGTDLFLTDHEGQISHLKRVFN